jgi:hypothetical protein
VVTYLSNGVALDADRAEASLEAVDRASWMHLEASVADLVR